MEPKRMYSTETLRFRSGPGISYFVENFTYSFADAVRVGYLIKK